MKKLFTRFALMAVVALAAIGCSNSDEKSVYTDAIPDDALVVCYLDADQIVEKGDFGAELQSVVNMMAAEAGNQTVKELLDAKLGVDTEQPFYAFVEMTSAEDVCAAVVGQVKDVQKVKQAIAFVNNEIADLEQQTKGSNTVVAIEEAFIGYNDNTIIVAVYEGNDSGFETVFGYLEDSQSGKNKTLPNVSSFDMAMWMDMDNVYNLLEQINPYDDELMSAMAILEPYKQCSFTLGLAFEPGRITMSSSVENLPTEALANDCTRPCNNNFLSYTPKNSLAVMNFNIDGEKLNQTLNNMPESFYQALAEEEDLSATEMKEVIMMVAEYLKSINGDITLALDDVNIETEKVFAYGMCSVANSDIFDLFISEMGEKGEMWAPNKYEFDLDLGSPVFIGQEDNMLYASTPNTPSTKPSNAQNAEWINDVKGSAAYIVVNIKELLQNSSIKRAINEELYYASSSERKMIDKIMKLPSYAFYRGNGSEVTCSIVLQDKNTNALTQISTVLKSFIMQNL